MTHYSWMKKALCNQSNTTRLSYNTSGVHQKHPQSLFQQLLKASTNLSKQWKLILHTTSRIQKKNDKVPIQTGWLLPSDTEKSINNAPFLNHDFSEKREEKNSSVELKGEKLYNFNCERYLFVFYIVVFIILKMFLQWKLLFTFQS